MEQCQADTLETLGPGAAGRLANWQKHESDLPRLLRFVKERLRAEARENGRKLELSGNLRLERMAVPRSPELLGEEHIAGASATCQGLGNIGRRYAPDVY